MIPNTELSVHPMLIYIAFLSVLGCFKIFSDIYNLLLHLLEQFWTKHNPVHWIIPSHWCPTPSAIQSFIRVHPQGCLLSIVIIFPLGWFIHHIHAKHIFKHLVYSLYLTINLRMVGSAEVQLCTQICKQTLPKIGSELRIPIRDYFLRKSLQSENILHEYFAMESVL